MNTHRIGISFEKLSSKHYLKWHAGQTDKKNRYIFIDNHRKGISFRIPTDLINMNRQAGQTENRWLHIHDHSQDGNVI